MKKLAQTEPTRKTIMERAREVNIKDPAAFSRQQVSELDKTAKNSQAKRKQCIAQVESDNQEIAHIEAQIARIKSR
jgi:hypothetical protein